MELIENMLKPNIELNSSVNSRFKALSSYLELQKAWKFYYICYLFYIKNLIVPNDYIEQYGANVYEEAIFQEQK